MSWREYVAKVSGMVVQEVFAVIAEGTRRDILSSLAREQKAVGQLVEELGVSQPTVSKHLRVLRDAGVVTMRAQGQKRFYSINTAPLVLASAWLDGLGAGVPAAVVPVSVPGAVASGAVAVVPGSDALVPGAAPVVHSVDPSHAETMATAQPTAQPTTPAAAVLPPSPQRPGSTVALPGADVEPSVQQHITRSVGRAATKAADLLANLPSFRRRRD